MFKKKEKSYVGKKIQKNCWMKLLKLVMKSVTFYQILKIKITHVYCKKNNVPIDALI